MNSQIELFFVDILAGCVICLIFDIFRALRKTIHTSNLVTYIEDIIFWILSSSILIYIIFILNGGILRGYIFVGLALGMIMYFFTISKNLLKVLEKLLEFIKSFILKLSKTD